MDQTQQTVINGNQSSNQSNNEDNDRVTLRASDGAGPLLQRDYSAIIENSRFTPEEIMQEVFADFPRFAPSELADFSCAPDWSPPLKTGHEMEINIKAAGLCHVRIVHSDARSLTMRTLDGHPEAGRISFGAFYNEAHELGFRIRSRARASTSMKYIGYELFGKTMQTQVWITFIERVAEVCGGNIRGEVQIVEEEVAANLSDLGELDTPTFAMQDRSDIKTME